MRFFGGSGIFLGILEFYCALGLHCLSIACKVQEVRPILTPFTETITMIEDYLTGVASVGKEIARMRDIVGSDTIALLEDAGGILNTDKLVDRMVERLEEEGLQPETIDFITEAMILAFELQPGA